MLSTFDGLEDVYRDIKALPNPYRAFFPLKRVKGKVYKVHRLKLKSYSRYLYLNPIEGVLISYYNTNKFPHSPNYIVKLTEIKEHKSLLENKWFFKNGQYYFRVSTEQKQYVFY